MKTKRINAGIYDIAIAGRAFEIEQYPDGNWLVFEANGEGTREYHKDFVTLRAAKAYITRHAEPDPYGDEHRAWVRGGSWLRSGV
jgi:hypothetical protein